MINSGLPGETVRRFQMLFSLGVTGVSDSDLLDRFLADQEETAFEALLDRHGPMVLSVCRRILRDPHDVEDAFQATFLVLVKKARTISDPNRLGNWLYGAAFRTALEARKRSLARRKRERSATPMDEPAEDPAAPDHNDLQECLDSELSALAEKYRSAIVLCDLEGLSRKDAAHRLGIREGTLSSRLNRGRGLLKDRLARRGIHASVIAITAVLATEAQAATVSPFLIQSTVRAAVWIATGHSTAVGMVSAAAVALSQGVLKSMLLNKLKILTVTLFTTGAVTAGVYVQAQPPPTTGGPATPSVPAPPAVVTFTTGGGAAPMPTPAGVEEDRLGKLERKLDRLIEVLERRVGDEGGVATTLYQRATPIRPARPGAAPVPPLPPTPPVAPAATAPVPAPRVPSPGAPPRAEFPEPVNVPPSGLAEAPAATPALALPTPAHRSEIEQMESRIKSLEAEVRQLRDRIGRLEARGGGGGGGGGGGFTGGGGGFSGEAGGFTGGGGGFRD